MSKLMKHSLMPPAIRSWNQALVALGASTILGTVGEGIFGLLAIVSILHERGSVLSISSLMVLMILPSILLAPFQGVFLDRVNIRNAAVLSNLFRSFIVLVLAGVTWEDPTNISALYLAIVMYYIVWYFMVPLSETLVARVTAVQGRHNGMVLLQGAWQVGALGSAFIAGALLTITSTPVVLVIIAILDGLSAICFLFIRSKTIDRDSNSEYSARLSQVLRSSMENFKRDLIAGIHYIQLNRSILVLVIVAATVFPFYQSINTLLGPFNQRVLSGNPFSLGLIEGMAGVGSFVSALICIKFKTIDKSFKLLIASLFLLLISVVAFPAIRSIGLAAVGYFVIGVFSGNAKVASKSILVQVVDKRYIGRITSISALLALILGVASALFSGLLALKAIWLGYSIAAILVVSAILLTKRLKVPLSDGYAPHIEADQPPTTGEQ